MNSEELNRIKEYVNSLSWSEKKPDIISNFVSNNIGIPCDVKISPLKRKIDITMQLDEDIDIKTCINTTAKFCGKEEINGKISITLRF